MKLLDWQRTNKISNRDLAARVGVTDSFVSHYHAGRRNFSPRVCLVIEKETGGAVTRDELLYRELYPDTNREYSFSHSTLNTGFQDAKREKNESFLRP